MENVESHLPVRDLPVFIPPQPDGNMKSNQTVARPIAIFVSLLAAETFAVRRAAGRSEAQDGWMNIVENMNMAVRWE